MIKSSLAEEESFLPSYKIIILGKAAAGKTKLLTRYRYGTFEETRNATLMVDYTLV
jgi:GTPase SAR1 family protein